MRAEIPAFQRCCVCIPLRYGLIVWGYYRLLLAGYILVTICFDISRCVELMNSEEEKHKVTTSNIIILCLTLIIMIADIILGILFIVGCHKKNVSILERYYHYSLVLLALLVPLCLYNFGRTLNYMSISKMPWTKIIFLFVPEFIATISYVVIQIYIVLLVRSEILKLRKEYQFRFENKVTQGECFVNIEDSIEGKLLENLKAIDDDD
ncbi:unnamed protein product [Arctia plantaginis]|uniref:Uncharacterized protein n=1 Tax=Arctia plantaginis TaxID=874455 RepID=A0A8S0Z6K6_ARCPL|nr:unnamed protein product [Arctia plantaginis]CAB3228278.1 unnamed protein product [Arctia plantaginis]